HTLLEIPRRRRGLLRREAVIGGQVMQDVLGLGWTQRQSVQTHHPLDGPLPPLGRCPNPRDAGKIAVFVGVMTPAALGDRRLVGDGVPLLCFLGGQQAYCQERPRDPRYKMSHQESTLSVHRTTLKIEPQSNLTYAIAGVLRRLHTCSPSKAERSRDVCRRRGEV